MHVTVRARKGLPSFRDELVRDMLLGVLSRQRQKRRPYAGRFHVVHFSIQSNHLHMIVEAENGSALRAGISGLEIAFSKHLAELLRAKRVKVWSERYHSRELGSPRDVRNALVYLFGNFKKHGVVTHGDGLVDSYSSAPSFVHWHVARVIGVPLRKTAGPPVWEPAPPNTWLLGRGWKDHYGPLCTSDRPAALRSTLRAM